MSDKDDSEESQRRLRSQHQPVTPHALVSETAKRKRKQPKPKIRQSEDLSTTPTQHTKGQRGPVITDPASVQTPLISQRDRKDQQPSFGRRLFQLGTSLLGPFHTSSQGPEQDNPIPEFGTTLDLHDLTMANRETQPARTDSDEDITPDKYKQVTTAREGKPIKKGEIKKSSNTDKEQQGTSAAGGNHKNDTKQPKPPGKMPGDSDGSDSSDDSDGSDDSPGGDSDTASEVSGIDRSRIDERPIYNVAYRTYLGQVKEIKRKIQDHDDGTKIMSLAKAETCKDILKEMRTYMSDLTMKARGLYPKIKAPPVNATITTQELADYDTEKKLRSTIMKAQQKLNTMHYTASERAAEIVHELTPSKMANKLQTPKIQLPKFTGRHGDWITFRDSFQSMIIRNGTFSKSDKLRFLIDACKEGDAKGTFDDLKIIDNNWEIGWERLKDRYNSSRELAYSALKPMLEAPALMFESEAGLHKLLNTMRTTRTQLLQIDKGGVTTEDIIFQHFLFAKLDKLTFKKFNDTVKGSNIPSLKQCEDFLTEHAKKLAIENTTRKDNQGVGIIHQSQLTNFKRLSRRHRHEQRHVHASWTDGSDSDASSWVESKSPTQRGRRRASPHPNKSHSPSARMVHFNARKGFQKKPSKPIRGRSKSPGNRPFQSQLNKPTRIIQCIVCNDKTHGFWQCPQFQRMDVNKRRQWVQDMKRCFLCLGTHMVNTCKSQFTCSVCKNKHHRMLHKDRQDGPTIVHVISSTVLTALQGNGLLPTCVVEIQNRKDKRMARALLDSGAQDSFITYDMSKRMRLPTSKKLQVFRGVGGTEIESRGAVTITVRSRIPPYMQYTIRAVVIDDITTMLPQQSFNVEEWNHLKGIPLADPLFNETGNIDLLLGSSIFNDVLQEKIIKGDINLPSAIKTTLGFIVMGAIPIQHNTIKFSATTLNVPQQIKDKRGQFKKKDEPSIDFNLQKMWELDEVPHPKLILSKEDEFAEAHYTRTTKRLSSGRYEISWPFMNKITDLGDSYKMARSRFMATERKLQKSPTLAKEYHDQLQDYLNKGQMELVPAIELSQKPAYYIPHHAVVKESSKTTKVRVVFDASAQTENGPSLNDLMAKGPTIQPDLMSQLLAFTMKKVAFTADISRMYRQILVNPKERNLARILWRKDPSKPLLTYRLLCVPFGIRAAPYVSIRTLHQIAKDEGEKRKEAVDVLHHSFYVDDLLHTTEDVPQAIKIMRDVTTMLKTAGMSLEKWSSNSPEFMRQIPKALQDSRESLPIEDYETVKTLGLTWHPKTDVFQFTVQPPTIKGKITKRIILSEISKTFDPLGFLGPVMIKAKILMQNIWKINQLGWDDPVPFHILKSWLKFATNLTKIAPLQIQRSHHYQGDDWHANWQLHGFCDASQDAYGAVFYLRRVPTKIEAKTNKVQCKLLMSKTRVAPLKLLTIPRLELQAAHLMAQWTNYIIAALQIPIQSIHFWTDSEITLHWVHNCPSKYGIFIANRISQIKTMVPEAIWHHVRSKENPADLISRGLDPQMLAQAKLWWHGPQWIQQNDKFLPFNPATKCISPEAQLEMKKQKEQRRPPTFDTRSTTRDKSTDVGVDMTEQHIDITDATIPNFCATTQQPPVHPVLQYLIKISSWRRLVRVMSMLLCIKSQRSFKYAGKETQHLQEAEAQVFEWIQQETYIFAQPGISVTLYNDSIQQYNMLGIWKAKDGLFRVGGRLRKADVSYEVKHPVLLPSTHPLIRVLIRHVHQKLGHAGVMTVAVHMCQKYWIPQVNKTIKSVIKSCYVCIRNNPKPEEQLMGDLPSARVNISRAFTKIGVDNAGPYLLRPMFGRKGTYKVWICLFTCLASRAVHLELTTTLSQVGFLMCLRRFISRRGKPAEIYSDNGLNFVGAANILANDFDTLQNGMEAVLQREDWERIKWRFNPPSAPHKGGAWESMVKVMKTYFKKITTNETYTWEQFETILQFTEAMMNSRPLTPMSPDPHDMTALTPAHFLIGGPLTTLPDLPLQHLQMNRLDRFQQLVRHQQDLWKLWQHTYITTLQKRNKWKKPHENLKKGDLVLLMQDESSPFQWKLARIIKTTPDNLGIVRIVEVETNGDYITTKQGLSKISKTFTRPINKIAKLSMIDKGEAPAPEVQLKEHMTRSKTKTKGFIGLIQKQPMLVALHWIAALTIASQARPAQASHNITLINAPQEMGSVATMSWSSAKIVFCCALILAICGSIGNLMTIFTILMESKLRKNYINWFILSLAMDDFLFCAIALPLIAHNYYHKAWTHDYIGCVPYVIVLYGTLICSLNHLVIIAVNRYVKICHSWQYPLFYTKRTILGSIIFTWSLSFLITIPSALQLWGKIDVDPMDTSSCTIIEDDNGNSPKTTIWICGCIIPVTILTFCYSRIYCYARASQLSVTSHRHSDDRVEKQLFKMITMILVSFVITFQPLIMLKSFDPHRQWLPASFHVATHVLAWSGSVWNIFIYAITNQQYREGYLNLYRSLRHLRMRHGVGGTLQTIFLLGCCIHGIGAITVPPSQLQQWLRPCDTPANEPTSEIPPCMRYASWLQIQVNGAICYHHQRCNEPTTMLSTTGHSCYNSTDEPCEQLQDVLLDNFECQTHNTSAILDGLQTPHTKTQLCSIGNFHIRNCDHFIEEFAHVPILMIGGQAYPVQTLHMQEEINVTNIASYKCKGECDIHKCLQQKCTGDTVFCTNIGCTNEIRPLCSCILNPIAVLQKYKTAEVEIYPDCWGTLYLQTKRENYEVSRVKYPCNSCDISCTRKGIRILTPDATPKYIRTMKAPAVVNTHTTTRVNDIHFTKQMLSTGGKIEIEIWFSDYDIPTPLEVICARISTCDLITCRICYEKWQNPQCYEYWHWAILSMVGLISLMSLVLMLYFVRIFFKIIHWVTWPFQTIWKICKKTRARYNVKQPKMSIDEESEIPLIEISRSPYQTTTAIRKPQSRNRKIGFWKTITIMTSINLGAYGCDNFASMSATTRECSYSTTGQATCSIRLNTRIALSSLGRTSCFKIETSKRGHLGTIEIEAKSVNSLCVKEHLYFTPQATVKCQSALKCYNVYDSALCHGWKCRDFNNQIKIGEFRNTENNLGWNLCTSVRSNQCWWPMTSDCIFERRSLSNDHNLVYAVFRCAEWRTSVKIAITFHFGDKTITNTTMLQIGQTTEIQNIQFDLISASSPNTPILNQCVLARGKKMALSPCNKLQELTMNRIGEIQCDSIPATQKLNQSCKASQNLIRSIADPFGVKCIGELINPEIILKENQLPLKLENGVLTPHEDTVVFEQTTENLLEVQMTSSNLQLTSQIQNINCEVRFIKIDGNRGSSTGANLIIEAKAINKEGTGTIECETISFYHPIHLTIQGQRYTITMKIDEAEVNLTCTFQCSQQKIPLHITGSLAYLAEEDIRSLETVMAYSPPQPSSMPIGGTLGNIWSFMTNDYTKYITEIIIIIGIGFFLFILITTCTKMTMKKLL